MLLITVRETSSFVDIHTTPVYRLVGMASRMRLADAIDRIAKHAEVYTECHYPSTVAYSVVAVTSIEDLTDESVDRAGMVNVESLCTSPDQMAASRNDQEVDR